LIKFEKEWWEAFKARDKAALERILADEFLGFDFGAGNPKTKSSVDRQRDGQELSRRLLLNRAD